MRFPFFGAKKNTFTIWAFGDAHVGSDLTYGKRESLREAIEQSESNFEWDIAIDVGDMSGEGGPPRDPEGAEVVRQFQTLKKHRREDVYSVAGNHDRSGLDEPEQWWWKKWVDPMGEQPQFSGVRSSYRRYSIDGTWERYSFRVGNVLFLMMSDINERTQTVGRGPLRGNPGGVVSAETFEWWKRMVEAHKDLIIVSVHHYVLKDTTVASGDWEGLRKDAQGNWMRHYHGYFPEGTPKGTSYLYWVGGVPDAQAFERYLQEHPGATDMWLGGHTHTNPDDTYGGKSHIEKKWSTYFLNVGALSGYHILETTTPMSRVLTFTEGSDEVRVRCYLHTDQYAPQGWYDKAERTLRLGKAFHH